jgi:signal transduction histidine kinase
MLDNLGLLATLEWFCRDFQSLHPRCHLDLNTKIEEEEIPDSLKVAIFRIVQEALNNVAKHSGAKRVEVSVIENEDSIGLVIQDEGVGFDLNSTIKENSGRGIGLAGMRERVEVTAGTFRIESAPGKGTTLRAFWPI